MRAKISTSTILNPNILGIELIAENDLEKKILSKFYEEGVKINDISNDGDALGLTFKGLIHNKKPPIYIEKKESE